MQLSFLQKILINILLRPSYSYQDPKDDPLFDFAVDTVLSVKGLDDIDNYTKYWYNHNFIFGNEFNINTYFVGNLLPDDLNDNCITVPIPDYYDYYFKCGLDSYVYQEVSHVFDFIIKPKGKRKDVSCDDFYKLLNAAVYYNNHSKDSLNRHIIFDTFLDDFLDSIGYSYNSVFDKENYSSQIKFRPSYYAKDKTLQKKFKTIFSVKKDLKERIETIAKDYKWYLVLTYYIVQKISESYLIDLIGNLCGIKNNLLTHLFYLAKNHSDAKLSSFASILSFNNFSDLNLLQNNTKTHNIHLDYINKYYYAVPEDDSEQYKSADDNTLYESLKTITIADNKDYSSYILPFIDNNSTDTQSKKAKDAFMQLYLNDELKQIDNLLYKPQTVAGTDNINSIRFVLNDDLIDFNYMVFTIRQNVPVKDHVHVQPKRISEIANKAFSISAFIKTQDKQKNKTISIGAAYLGDMQPIFKGAAPVAFDLKKRVASYYQDITSDLMACDHAFNDWAFHLENKDKLDKAATDLVAMYELSRIANELFNANAFVPDILTVHSNTTHRQCIKIVRFVPAIFIPKIARVTESVGHIFKNTELSLYVRENRNSTDLQAGVEILSVFLSSIVRRKTLVYMSAGSKALPSYFTVKDNVYTLFGYNRKGFNIHSEIYCTPLAREEKSNDFLNHLKSTIQRPAVVCYSSLYTPVLCLKKKDENNYSFEIKLHQEHDTALYSLKSIIDGIHSTLYGALEIFRIRYDLDAICKLLNLEANETYTYAISNQELSDFINHKLSIARALNIELELDKSLNKIYTPLPTLELKLDKAWSMQDGFLGLMDLIDFDWQIAIGDKNLSVEEFNRLLEQSKDILSYEGGTLVLDPETLQALKDKINKKHKISRSSLILAALTGRYQNQGIILDKKLKKALADIMAKGNIEQPRDLKATLRPYQLRGFNWLLGNVKVGIGSIIADDMGLGKTIQVIATLLAMHEAHEFAKSKALIVVPTSLLFNWSHELKSFAPSLGFDIVYGDNKMSDAIKSPHPLIITTYGYLSHNHKTFLQESYRILVIDEAQAIKNHTTQNAKNIKQIKAQSFIAMTGTPVENRLMEYWSIMDCVNPGLFGTAAEFKKNYVVPIEKEHDEAAIENLRTVVAPFVLRRLKTDKSIISDLPDKIVYNQYCNLSAVQTAMYQKTVDLFLDQLSSLKINIERQSQILTSILRLKQLCNSPALIEATDKNLQPENSGKVTNLLAILDDLINEKNKKVIIFTQFKVMGDLLVSYIEKALGFKPDFLNGTVPASRRSQMINSFQSDEGSPVLILSLKAGGSGINLTQASVVIHFDLWWNPAVENQATDRAYRIGQDKNVEVIRFICQDTLEEKIDTILSNKQKLSDLTVQENETWLGNMSDDEIQKIFALSQAKA